jgi:hypothetical protein
MTSFRITTIWTYHVQFSFAMDNKQCFKDVSQDGRTITGDYLDRIIERFRLKLSQRKL